MKLSQNQWRALTGIVAAFLVAIVPNVLATIGAGDALVTPIQALIAGVAGVLQMGDEDVAPETSPDLAGTH